MQELIWIGGPLLLAVLLATGKPQFPLLAYAAASISGTALYTLDLPASRERDTAARAPSPLREAGCRYCWFPRPVTVLPPGSSTWRWWPSPRRTGGTPWAGVLVAVWGIGSLVGGLAYGSRDWRRPVEGRAMACLALFAVLLLLLAAAPDLIMLAVLMIPLGMPLSPWLGSLSASVQRAVPAASSTEAFAWTFTVITAGIAAGSACGGMIIQAAGTRAALLAAGGCGLAGAASARSASSPAVIRSQASNREQSSRRRARTRTGRDEPPQRGLSAVRTGSAG